MSRQQIAKPCYAACTKAFGRRVTDSTWEGRRDACATILSAFFLIAAVFITPTTAGAQGFPNVPRTPGELLSGPIAPEQGRTAIVAWHGERIISIPEPPGSQPGADLFIRVVNIADPTNPQVTTLPASAGGFHSHAYFMYGPYMFTGGHCLTADLQACGTGTSVWRDSFRIGGSGTPIGGSQLRRANMEGDAGLPIGGIGKTGTQSPWGSQDFWTYGDIGGNTFLAVRRSLQSWIYDWSNGGAITGPAITAQWDHLAQTGVIGFPFIYGNILIYAADMTGTGVATYDISDLENPVLLDVLKDENPGGYWPEVYGHYIFFPRRDNEGGTGSQSGFMVVDFEDPTNLRVVADRNLEGSNQYVTFQDEYAFMNNYKIDLRTFEVVLELATNDVTLDASQFAMAVGNILVTGGYGSLGPGLAFWAHQADPDTRPPFVAYHIPRPDQTNYSIHCPITLSIPETLRCETIVNGTSLIVRPVGGAAVDTWHAFSQGKLLTVTPRQPLAPDTTYEVILSGIEDAAGNAMEPYTFRFSTGGALSGGNQPPTVEAITANPEAGAPGQMVEIAWGGSDPEGGAVETRIDFGDGTPRTPWGAAMTAAHTYVAAGHYQLTVQVRDAQGSVSARSRTVTIVAPPVAPNSTASSQMVVDSGASRVYVVNPDDDTLTAMNSATMAPMWEAPTARDPRGVALGSDGALWVVCHDDDAIDILDAATGALNQRLPLNYGAAPIAIAPGPGATGMLVSCTGDGTLRRFDVASRTQTGQLALGPTPRAIAVTQDGTRALVTRFISGQHVGSVYDVALAGPMSLTRTISLERDKSMDGSASSRGVPNYLAGIRIAPDGRYAWVVGKKDNTNRGTFFAASMLPGQDNTVRAQLMLIDLQTNAEDRSLRLDIDNSDSPVAVAFSPLGDYGFIALQGNAAIAVIDTLDFMQQESPGTVKTRWGVGVAPQAVEVEATTGRIFAHNFMGRSVTRLEAAAFLFEGSANVASSAATTAVQSRLHPEVEHGKQLFYNASDPRMSAEGYISCATCHADGTHDGRTFDFTNRGEGFRNTVDLRGRSGAQLGPVHWSANFDEIQDFENDIRSAFGGTGFMTNSDFAATEHPLGAPKTGLNADLDALSAYLTSLGPNSLPRSPHRHADGTMTDAAVRGYDVFVAQNCNSCHIPENQYIDGGRNDVGTLRASSGGRLGGPLDSIDTPTLLGLHDSAPYFHDGSAATLEEVFTIAGGRLAQAESGIMSNGAVAEDIPWMPMKEWHQGQFVVLDGSRTVTFNDVMSASAGAGFLEVRYNSGYGNSTLNITVNGVQQQATLPITPNDPQWMPNEWRAVRVPVTYQSGANTFAFREGPTGAALVIDDILFCTPGDLARAFAHVRPGMSAGDRDDLLAFLRQLDGSNAPPSGLAVQRESVEIAQGATDLVGVFPGTMGFTVTYTIANTGPGPLNLGAFSVVSDPPGAITISQHPAPHVPHDTSTELRLLVTTSTGNPSASIRGFSDHVARDPMLWGVQVSEVQGTINGALVVY